MWSYELSRAIMREKLRRIWHFLRMKADRLPKIVLVGQPSRAKTNASRPWMEREDVVMKNLRNMEASWEVSTTTRVYIYHLKNLDTRKIFSYCSGNVADIMAKTLTVFERVVFSSICMPSDEKVPWVKVMELVESCWLNQSLKIYYLMQMHIICWGKFPI